MADNQTSSRTVDVIVIDDNPRDVEFLRDILRASRDPVFQVRAALSLGDGLLLIEKQKPSVVCLDLNLTDSHGLQSLNALVWRFRDIPIILMVGPDAEEEALRGLRCGAQDYLVKGSIDPGLLTKQLARAMIQKEIEGRLRYLAEYQEKVIDSAVEGIAVVDNRGRIVLINQAARHILGCELADALDRKAEEIFQSKEGNGAELAKVIHSALEEGKKGEIERLVLSRRDGGDRMVNFLTQPVLNGSKSGGAIIAFQDLSGQLKVENKLKGAIQEQLGNEQKLVEALEELRSVNQKLQETQDQLIQAEKLQSIGRLAAGVAHEVKNPLAILLQGIEFLQLALTDQEGEVRQVLQDMFDAVRRADMVIKDLLDYAAPADESELQETDIRTVLEDSLAFLKPLLNKNKIVVQKDFPDVPVVAIDVNRIQQVFINLITNSIHAMPEGGSLKVAVEGLSEKSPKGKVRICIDDEGCGVPPDLMGRVFDPFVTTRRGKGGTGLGLSVVRGIIEMHHGEIKIENRDPKGVRATVIL